MFEIRVAVCQENVGPICVLPIICKQTRRHLYFQSIPPDMMRVWRGGRGNNGEWLKGGPCPFYRNLYEYWIHFERVEFAQLGRLKHLLIWSTSKKNLKIFKIGLVGMNSLYWHWCFPTKLDFPFHYSFLDTYEKNINKLFLLF